MKSQNKEIVDKAGELIDKMYQVWKILYDGGEQNSKIVLVYVKECKVLLDEIAAELNSHV